MSAWLPSNLPKPFQDVARAIDKQFAPLRPGRPPRLVGLAQADLTDDHASRHPYCVCINTDKGALAVSVLVGGVWTWRDYDGSAL